MELITLKSYQSSMKAHMDRIKLEGEGIPCAVFDEHSLHNVPLYDLATGGIKLKVRDEDVVKALGILSKTRQAADAGNGNERIVCPHCHSTDIKSTSAHKSIISTMLSFFISLASPSKRSRYKCENCGKEF